MTVGQISKLTIEQLDAEMIRLTGKPFVPGMSLASRRRTLHRESVRQELLDKVKTRHPALNKLPKAFPKTIPYEAMLERVLAHAARGCVGFADAVNITQAHLLGDGMFSDDYISETMRAFTRIHDLYGWGLRQHSDGVIEVYC